MPYQLSISEDAKFDILDAFLWYEDQREGLGLRFEVSIEASLQKISTNPKSFQSRYDDVHVHFIQRFPYGIHYLIEKDEVKVIGVFHTSRDPINWNERL